MTETSIDSSELKELIDRLEGAPAAIKAAKKQAISSAATKLKSIVDQEVGGSGKVRNWQGKYVGSLGLYAAVRPKAETYATDHQGRPTKYAVGYVTNAINSGHRFPLSKLGYRSRAGKVPGKQFYQRAQVQAEQVAQETAQQIVQALTDHLGG